MLRRIWTIMLMLTTFAGWTQFSPGDVDGLQLWLRSDSLVTTEPDGKVSAWGNAVSGDDGAAQGAGNLQPFFADEVLNGYPAVRFDGFNDFMTFPEQGGIQTVFIVLSEDEDAPENFQPILGHSSLYPFHRGAESVLLHPDFADPGVLEGTTRINFEEVDGTQETIPATPSLVSMVSTSGLSVNQLSVDRTLFTRVWDGDWFELLLYDQELSPEDREQVENYLADKYMPALPEIPDLVSEDLCDSLLCVNDAFVSYSWNGVDAGNCFTFNSSQTMTLEVTDSFGRVSSQEFEVNFPGASGDVLLSVCAGDSVEVFSGLESPEFSVTWSNGDVGNSTWISSSGSYSYTAEDDNGCIVERGPWDVFVDDFSELSVLPPEIALCNGDVLAAEVGEEEVVSFLWNDAVSENTLVVNAPGEVWVAVENMNGCIARDTTLVIILGNVPEVNASVVSEFCEGETVTWEASVISEDGIASFVWDIDGVLIETGGPVLNATPEGWGLKQFELVAETTAGCAGSASGEFLVHPQPVVAFDEPSICPNTEIEISPMVEYPDGGSGEIFWISATGSIAQENFFGSFSEAGSYPLELAVVSNQGCSGSYSGVVEVYPIPLLDFTTSSPRCVGEDVLFEGSWECPNCLSEDFFFSWNFGDGNASGQQNSEHFFTEEGNYQVSFQALTLEGCIAERVKTVYVYSYPDVDFTGGPFCSGQLGQLTDFSSGIALGNYVWEIDGLGPFGNGPFIQVTFPEPGVYEVYHEAGSGGCVSSMTGEVVVSESPDPGFSVIQIGLPHDYQAIAVEGAAVHDWFVNGALSGNEVNPLLSFDSVGTYVITHEITAAPGCTSLAELELEVVTAESDIAVTEIVVTPVPEGFSILARVLNNSTFTVGSIAMSLGIDGVGPTEEFWEVSLAPGQQADYLFSQFIPYESTGMVCAEAQPVGAFMPEYDASNNRSCHPLESAGVLFLDPYPNPATDHWNIDVYLSRREDSFSAELFDSAGRLVREFNGALPEGFNRVEINARGLRPGIYQLFVGEQGEDRRRFQVMVSPLED